MVNHNSLSTPQSPANAADRALIDALSHFWAIAGAVFPSSWPKSMGQPGGAIFRVWCESLRGYAPKDIGEVAHQLHLLIDPRTGAPQGYAPSMPQVIQLLCKHWAARQGLANAQQAQLQLLASLRRKGQERWQDRFIYTLAQRLNQLHNLGHWRTLSPEQQQPALNESYYQLVSELAQRKTELLPLPLELPAPEQTAPIYAYMGKGNESAPQANANRELAQQFVSKLQQQNETRVTAAQHQTQIRNQREAEFEQYLKSRQAPDNLD